MADATTVPARPGVSPRAERAPRSGWFGRRGWAYLFVLPAICALGFTFGYPLVEVVRYSFYAGTVGQLVPVGLTNYKYLYHDTVFLHSVLNNIKLLATVPIMTVLALAIALILNAGYRGMKAYRAIVFVPYILPATAIGLTFSYLLAQKGILNTLLTQWHLEFLAKNWLGSATWVVPSIGGVIVWQQLGFGIVVFAAALLAVPTELVEAARMDGANSWQVQTRILIPSIRRVIEFFVVLEAITMLSAIFTYVYVLTQGGPAYASSVMELYVYQNGFQDGAIGLASAAAVVLLGFASILIVIYLQLRARADRDR